MSALRHMRWPLLVAAVSMALAFAWAGWHGMLDCLLLMALEVGFSFDNAVMNATVLRQMDKAWQERFLTWGLPIIVCGIYGLFPLLIVAAATHTGLLAVAHMAFADPVQYSERFAGAQVQISAFGGVFLLMVLFNFLFDEGKKLHWIGPLERRLVQLGKLELIEAALAVVVLFSVQFFLPDAARPHMLVAGMAGLVLYVLVSTVSASFGAHGASPDAARYSGLRGYIYLETLDASLSLDAVVGAFAISSDIVIIMLGLAVGALFVRTITVHMVRRGTLEQFVFLEHGAHYGIGALAIIMFINMRLHVPDVVTGLIGVACILLSLKSSVKYRKGQVR